SRRLSAPARARACTSIHPASAWSRIPSTRWSGPCQPTPCQSLLAPRPLQIGMDVRSCNRRILGLARRRRRRRGRGRLVVRVVVVMAAPTSGSASPRTPDDEAEEEEPDQQDPEQAEEGEEPE